MTVDDRSFQNLGWGRRKSLRRQFGYPGIMQFEHGAGACVIVDMSETGAQLEVPANAEVPAEFSLLIGGNASVRRRCRLVWRSGTRIGVRFGAAIGKPPAGSARDGKRSTQPA